MSFFNHSKSSPSTFTHIKSPLSLSCCDVGSSRVRRSVKGAVAMVNFILAALSAEFALSAERNHHKQGQRPGTNTKGCRAVSCTFQVRYWAIRMDSKQRSKVQVAMACIISSEQRSLLPMPLQCFSMLCHSGHNLSFETVLIYSTIHLSPQLRPQAVDSIGSLCSSPRQHLDLGAHICFTPLSSHPRTISCDSAERNGLL